MSDDIDAWRTIAQAATPGPWTVADDDGETVAIDAPDVGMFGWFGLDYLADATFIATFDPPTVLGLLNQNETLRTALREIVAGWDEPWRDEHHPSFAFMRAIGAARELSPTTAPQELKLFDKGTIPGYPNEVFQIIGWRVDGTLVDVSSESRTQTFTFPLRHLQEVWRAALEVGRTSSGD